jgi:hypothetical protein
MRVLAAKQVSIQRSFIAVKRMNQYERDSDQRKQTNRNI